MMSSFLIMCQKIPYGKTRKEETVSRSRNGAKGALVQHGHLALMGSGPGQRLFHQIFRNRLRAAKCLSQPLSVEVGLKDAGPVQSCATAPFDFHLLVATVSVLDRCGDYRRETRKELFYFTRRNLKMNSARIHANYDNRKCKV
ncbi:hypothetical protein Tcan_05137 [Toxocara canis]|uniref:Uncharacterized protein n=1 Tax=Toxocara canis TaxID=6265 RepID=A0A0B2V087_TOXCA|nr:hypothetical protein Tcan_05137 [Toxocara canis]